MVKITAKVLILHQVIRITTPQFVRHQVRIQPPKVILRQAKAQQFTPTEVVMEMAITRRAQVFTVMVHHAQHRTLQVQIPVLIPLLLLQDIIVAEVTLVQPLKQEKIRIGNNTYTHSQLQGCGCFKNSIFSLVYNFRYLNFSKSIILKVHNLKN